MIIEIKTAGIWKGISAEDFRRKFYTPAMHSNACSILRRSGYLRAGANEFRIAADVAEALGRNVTTHGWPDCHRDSLD